MSDASCYEDTPHAPPEPALYSSRYDPLIWVEDTIDGPRISTTWGDGWMETVNASAGWHIMPEDSSATDAIQARHAQVLDDRREAIIDLIEKIRANPSGSTSSDALALAHLVGVFFIPDW